jgi:hypothetical protein
MADFVTAINGGSSITSLFKDDYIEWGYLLATQQALNAQFKTGTGSPEGSVMATVGALYFQTDGTNGTTLWVKVSGSGNTGWRNLPTIDSDVASVTLTATQVKALFTTPQTLVAAPGVGKIILVDRITFASTFVSAAYTGANALEFRYTDASGAKVTDDIAATTLNFASGTRYATVAGVAAELQAVANAPIVVCVPTANPGAGDSVVKFNVQYRVETLP